jgi:LysM repeat protein
MRIDAMPTTTTPAIDPTSGIIRPRLSIVRLDANGAPSECPMEVEFNPEEYTLNKDNNFASQSIPGLSSPLLQFVNGNLRTLDMELFFDTWDDKQPAMKKRDVRTLTEPVVALMAIDSDLHAPPVLQVAWASLQFQCVLAKITQKFILFRPDGIPVRAKLNVTFNEFLGPEQQAAQTPKFSSDLSKVHVVLQGETLSDIAYKFYQDPTSWRPLALANDIDDPLGLSAGQVLRVPPLPFLDPDTGEAVS